MRCLYEERSPDRRQRRQRRQKGRGDEGGKDEGTG